MTPEHCAQIAERIEDQAAEIFKGRAPETETLKRGETYTDGYSDGAGAVAIEIRKGADVSEKVNERLSSYAFREFGGDAKLYNGIHDLEQQLDAVTAERDSIMKTTLRSASLSMDMLETAGCGKIGKPNTLLDMVAEIIQERDTLILDCARAVCAHCADGIPVTAQHGSNWSHGEAHCHASGIRTKFPAAFEVGK